MFNIGDIVEAKPRNGYVVTTKENAFIGEVVAIRYTSDDSIRVKVIANYAEHEIGNEYWVKPGRFLLCKEARTPEIEKKLEHAKIRQLMEGAL